MLLLLMMMLVMLSRYLLLPLGLVFIAVVIGAVDSVVVYGDNVVTAVDYFVVVTVVAVPLYARLILLYGCCNVLG